MAKVIIPIKKSLNNSRNEGITLKSFDKEIMDQVLINLLNDFIQEYAKNIGHEVVDNTPVATGRLRGSIGIANNLSDLSIAVPDKDGGMTKSRIDQEAKQLKVNEDFVIGSSVDYADDVEIGTSDTTPDPFFRQAIANHTSHANKASQSIKPRRS